MSNFGFMDLRLVKPYDVAFREARSAVRSHYILEKALVCGSVAEAVAEASLVVGTTAVGTRNLHVAVHRLEPAGQLLREHLSVAPAALLFGSEKFGLSNEDLSYCHWLLRIPTREEHGSMNLGQAVAICLYELSRIAAEESMRFAKPPVASAEDQERFTVLLLEALNLSGYVNERTTGTTELKVRRLVRRLSLSDSDADTWLGMLRQILWRLKK